MNKLNKNSGIAALLITFVILGIGSIIALSASFIFLNRIESSRNVGFSDAAYFAAEGGTEDALLRFLDPARQVPSSYSVTLGNAVADVTVATDVFNVTTINSDANLSSRQRTLQVQVSLDPSATSLSFAAHIGSRGLSMDSNAVVNGNVFSNGNITGLSNTRINGNATAVGTISSPRPTVSGTKTQNASPVPLPSFDAPSWRTAADINNDPIQGNLTISSGTTTLGPKRINGNLTIHGNSSLIVSGPIYVVGNIKVESNADIFLSESFGSSNTVILADGQIAFDSNAQVHATSASPAGYIMLVSLSLSDEAIKLASNQEIDAVFYAVQGDIELESNADVSAIIGEGVDLQSNAEINFDLGLIQQIFSPSGTGGYAIIDWREQ